MRARRGVLGTERRHGIEGKGSLKCVPAMPWHGSRAGRARQVLPSKLGHASAFQPTSFLPEMRFSCLLLLPSFSPFSFSQR